MLRKGESFDLAPGDPLADSEAVYPLAPEVPQVGAIEIPHPTDEGYYSDAALMELTFYNGQVMRIAMPPGIAIEVGGKLAAAGGVATFWSETRDMHDERATEEEAA